MAISSPFLPMLRPIFFLFLILSIKGGQAEEKVEAWPQWRGPLMTGEAPKANPPTEWNEEKNVLWKKALPGLGHSTPVVWGKRLFLTTAVPVGKEVDPVYDNAPGSHDNLPVKSRHQFSVLCLDRQTGEMLWQTAVHETFPHEGGHQTGSLASHSPSTDGNAIYAFFGSHGLFALDYDGRVLWKKQLGKMNTKHAHGEASSPCLHENALYINWDHEGESQLFAIDKRTGKEIWKRDRDELTSWSTPIVAMVEGKPQLIVSATNRIRAYDTKTGQVIWECGGMSQNVVATPVASQGMLYAACSYEKKAFLAIKLGGANGDITDSDHVVWKTNQRTPYVPSPLLYRNTLYFLNHYQGILSVRTATSGEIKSGPFRLGVIRNVYASPIAAADRIYITDLEGMTLVLSHEASPQPIAFNRLEDSFSASAVPVGTELYLRGRKYLYCLSEKKAAPIPAKE